MFKKLLNWFKPKPKPSNLWHFPLDTNELEKAINKQAPKKTLQKATTRSKTVAKNGLYANIHAKQERIKKEKAEGKPVEKMRKVGSKGAPTAEDFKQSAKTAKKK